MLGDKVLEKRKSEFNGEIVVKRTWGLGTYIQVDGITQSGGIIKNIWNPVLKIINHQSFVINHCLILGLGGGTVIEVVRKYWPDAEITGVEIDPDMIEIGTKYLKLNTTKIKIINADALNYPLPTNHHPLIIVDLYQGKKFPKEFETLEFLNKLKKSLKKDGVVCINRLRGFDEGFERKLKSTFSAVTKIKPLINTVFVCVK